MSSIPPTSIASMIQTAGAAQRATTVQQTEQNAGSERAKRFAEQLTLAIDETDSHMQVHADAEGHGGSGRDTHAAHDEKPDGDADAPPPDHVDLTA